MARSCSEPVLAGGPAGIERHLRRQPGRVSRPRAEQLRTGAASWRLLLQLDTDDDLGWMWGDVGRLYFTIRQEDLAAYDFSRAWMVLQCG
jgi:uncharacterized protein YwqG